MNIWTQKSIELANQRNYLDLLYRVYPLSVNLRREISDEVANELRSAVFAKDNNKLLETLISETNGKRIVFPVKDSYVAYLRHDNTALERNPNTVNRISGMLYELGFEEILNRATAPKETNRQIGPLFGNWMSSGALGADVVHDPSVFLSSTDNVIFGGSDEERANFATSHLGYTRDKGLDFLAKFNDKYIIGEAKFLSDFGGSQNSDFEDAELTLRSELKETGKDVRQIAIIDGVLYIDSCSGRQPASTLRTKFNDDEVIISAVLLRDYLYSL